jgi:hypothetical protein
MAHHTNYDMPADGRLFASDYMANEGYVFDLRKPEEPRLVASFGNAGTYTHPHSFERIANGHTLVTYQFNGAPDKRAGALVELDDKGHVVRTSDASDSEVEPFIRPYSLQVVPKLDRVVTSSADMLPNGESSHVVQVWRLSDLKLLKTVVLPKAPHFKDVVSRNATEPRLLEDAHCDGDVPVFRAARHRHGDVLFRRSAFGARSGFAEGAMLFEIFIRLLLRCWLR